MFSGYDGVWGGGEEYPEKSYIDICANTAKKGQTSTLDYKPWACLPTVFYHWIHFTAMQLMSQHNQGRNDKKKPHRLMKSKSLGCASLFLWQGGRGGCKRVTRQTQRKGTSEDTWKSRLKKEKNNKKKNAAIQTEEKGGEKHIAGNIPVKSKYAHKWFETKCSSLKMAVFRFSEGF